MKKVWQIAAGDPQRNYSELFINHDVMFQGPGKYGPYDAKKYDDVVKRGEFKAMKVGMVRRFCEKVKPGDYVLMRLGREALSIGVVADEGYAHDETFDDVHGWDLQHTRRVIWQGHLDGDLRRIQKNSPLFGHIRMMGTFNAVHSVKVLNRIELLFKSCDTRPLKDMPDNVPKPLTLEELGQKLFEKGIANAAVDKVIAAIERQRRLISWYKTHGDASKRPTEHEVVAHMILPLLLALGWSEQLLAIEWNRVDLAGFSGTPTTKENCVLVCEAKTMKNSLQNVLIQALRYAKKLPCCRHVLLTQGGRFYLYRRKHGEEWNETDPPIGYLNVEKIRTNHIAPAGTDAVDTLVALSPAGVLAQV